MSKKVIIFIAALCVIVAMGFLWWQDISKQPQKYTGPVEKITLGAIDGIEWGSPMYLIAEQQEYFVNNGLDVTLAYHEAGKLVLEALLRNEVDIATVADAAFVPKTFDNPDLQILGTIVLTDDMVRLTARRDRGITRPADLRGKRIGVTRDTIGHFFLGIFLLNYGLSYADITIVHLNPSQIVEAITTGDVDAASTWEPHSYKIERTLGANAIAWPEQINQSSYFLLIGKKKWVAEHRRSIERLLQALQEAEVHIEGHDKEIKELAQERFHVAPSYADFLWPKIKFNISLPQALLLALEDQARWAIENKLTEATEVPNYLDYIYFDALEAVKPEAVTIIH